MGVFNKFLKRAAAFVGGHPRDPALVSFFGGSNTTLDININEQTSQQAATVQACINVIAESIAILPCIMYRRLASGAKERAVEHPWYNVMYNRPNDVDTPFDMIQTAIENMCYLGAAYWQIVGNGKVREIRALDARSMSIQLVNGRPVYHYVDQLTGVSRIFFAPEIVRCFYKTRKLIYPLSVIEHAREAIAGEINITQQSNNQITNVVSSPMYARLTGFFASTEEKQKFVDDLQRKLTGGNRGKIVALEADTELKSLAISATDAQFLESRRYSQEQICGLFRVPPSLVGSNAQRTTPTEWDSIDFLRYTLMPWITRLEQSFDRDLLTDIEKQNYFFEFDVDTLLRADFDTRANYYKTGINFGWLNRAGVRERENLPPVEGLDDYLVPANLMRSSDLGKNLTGQGPQDGTENLNKNAEQLL